MENYLEIIGEWVCPDGSLDNPYLAFSEWSEAQGEKRPMSQQSFGMRLAERGFEKKRGTGGFYSWIGIRLSE